jgi:hypothetical protein
MTDLLILESPIRSLPKNGGFRCCFVGEVSQPKYTGLELSVVEAQASSEQNTPTAVTCAEVKVVRQQAAWLFRQDRVRWVSGSSIDLVLKTGKSR